jgi:hypothetical protein
MRFLPVSVIHSGIVVDCTGRAEMPVRPEPKTAIDCNGLQSGAILARAFVVNWTGHDEIAGRARTDESRACCRALPEDESGTQ